MNFELLVIPLVAMAGPFGLWFVEQLLPFPALIEETYKYWLVVRLNNPKFAPLLGLGFGLSETFLYLFNALIFEAPITFWGRILITVPMHTLTTYLMGVGQTKKIGGIWLWLLAVLFHASFNLVVINWVK